MSMNPLPPQAYTKETLLRAYSWLQNQPPRIRELASTPDILVSLYLKATRDGDACLDRPSIQNFKNELKNLAGLMGELESPGKLNPQKDSAEINENGLKSFELGKKKILESEEGPLFKESQGETPLQRLNLDSKLSLGESRFGLDLKSFEMIQEVKDQLNLSTELEALRLIVKLGHLQVTKLLK